MIEHTDKLEKIKKNLPDAILPRLLRLPPKEQLKVAGSVAGDIDLDSEMDEEAVAVVEKAIRYRDSEVSLVRMVLTNYIRNDYEEREEAEDIANEILKKAELSDVYKVYDKEYAKNKSAVEN